MKKILLLLSLFSFILIQAQKKRSPIYKKYGNMVKATYFYQNGKIKQEGFFKNKKLESTWKSYDKNGKKTAIAHYKNGKKNGKWLLWNKNELKEINYNNNTIVSVKNWKNNSKIAIK